MVENQISDQGKTYLQFMYLTIVVHFLYMAALLWQVFDPTVIEYGFFFVYVAIGLLAAVQFRGNATDPRAHLQFAFGAMVVSTIIVFFFPRLWTLLESFNLQWAGMAVHFIILAGFIILPFVTHPPLRYMFISLAAFFIPNYAQAILEQLGSATSNVFGLVILFTPIWLIYFAVSPDVPEIVKQRVSTYVLLSAFVMIFAFVSLLDEYAEQSQEGATWTEVWQKISPKKQFNPGASLQFLVTLIWGKFEDLWFEDTEGDEEQKSRLETIRAQLFDDPVRGAIARGSGGPKEAEKPPSGVRVGSIQETTGAYYAGKRMDFYADVKADALNVPVTATFSCEARKKYLKKEEDPVIIKADVQPARSVGPTVIIENDYATNLYCRFPETPELVEGTYDIVLTTDFNAESYSVIGASFVQQELMQELRSRDRLPDLFTSICPNIQTVPEPEKTQGTPLEIDLSFGSEQFPIEVPPEGAGSDRPYVINAHIQNTAGGKLKKFNELLVVVPKSFAVETVGAYSPEQVDCGALQEKVTSCKDDDFNVYKVTNLIVGTKKTLTLPIFMKIEGSAFTQSSCTIKNFGVIGRYDYTILRSKTNVKVEEVPGSPE